MALSGDLKSSNLSELFQMLGNSPELQVLYVRRGKGDEQEEKHFYFKPDGVHIELVEKKLGPIGNLFVSLGKITESQLNSALIEQRKGDKKLGEVLVELGQVTQEDVDVIGLSTLATDHLIVPDLMAALRSAGLDHVRVVVGGIIPAGEKQDLYTAGVKGIFGPGSSRDEIVAAVQELAAEARQSKLADLRL